MQTKISWWRLLSKWSLWRRQLYPKISEFACLIVLAQTWWEPVWAQRGKWFYCHRHRWGQSSALLCSYSSVDTRQSSWKLFSPTRLCKTIRGHRDATALLQMLDQVLGSPVYRLSPRNQTLGRFRLYLALKGRLRTQLACWRTASCLDHRSGLCS